MKMRDTDQDWNAIGKAEPFFGVLSADRYRTAQLTDERIAEFYRSGVDDIEYIRSVAVRTVGMPTRLNHVCDFGSGVGRLSFAMAAFAQRVIGVDVSESMRAEAAKRATQFKIPNTEFVSTLPEMQFDWINSLIVFQHIPPARGCEILDKAARLLSPGGLLTVQLTYAHDHRHVEELIAELGEYTFDGETVRRLAGRGADSVGEMRMYDYDLNSVFRLLHRNGIGSIWTEHTDHSGCHGLRLFGRR